MTEKKLSLTSADVESLLTNPSPDARAETAAKIADGFGGEALSPEERALAEDILRIMARDAETRVRRALAEHLKENPDIPGDVAVKLAQDVAEVATPILEYCRVLSDEDLMTIVRSKPAEHQKAIARRRSVSADLADALADSGDTDVVAILMANDGADIAENTFHKVLDRFSDDEEISASIIGRTQIPISVAEQLVTLVSDNLRVQLVERHELSADIAADLVLQSRERATVSLLEDESDRGSSVALVDHLYANGRLSSTIILRAICTGDLDFFEAAMAKLSGITVANAHTLILDQGHLGFRRLFNKCRMSEKLYPLFRVAVDVALETDYDGGPDDRRRYRDRMIQRVLTHFEDGFDRENLDYLIAKLGKHEDVSAHA